MTEAGAPYLSMISRHEPSVPAVDVARHVKRSAALGVVLAGGQMAIGGLDVWKEAPCDPQLLGA